MIESLEERANSARQSIGEVTGSVPDREFDPPQQHIGTATAVVFAVVLAAGGVWAIARGGGPQAADVAADGPDAVSATEDQPTVSDEPSETEIPAGVSGPIEPGTFLVFEEAPAGFEPIIFAESPVDEENLPTFDVYGSPSGDPFANGDLLVATIEVEPGETVVDPETPSMEINGETVWIEQDEPTNVVSFFRDTRGFALLSQSLTEDELIEKMTVYLETGIVDTGDLVLLDEGSKLAFPMFGGENVVLYQLPEPRDILPGKISGIVIASVPSTDSLLVDWFRSADPVAGPLPSDPPIIVEHNGWTIEADTGVENGLVLRFEVDGVPIHVTMLTDDMSVRPSIEDALVLLGNIRGATAAEIDDMTIRGNNIMGG